MIKTSALSVCNLTKVSDFMKKYYEQKQILILINQLCMIIFLCYEFSIDNIIGTAKLLPLLLITIMSIYGSYISFINLKTILYYHSFLVYYFLLLGSFTYTER